MEVARATEIFDYWFSGPDNYVVVWTKFTQVKRDGRGGGGGICKVRNPSRAYLQYRRAETAVRTTSCVSG